MLGREKVMIHANLSLSLMLGQIVFVSSSDAHKNPVACKAVAVLLHFLFMSAFSWMLVEGLALYLCCTKGIFNHRDMRVKYFLLGWGLPLIIVIISFAARFPDYGNGPQYSCWLSIDDGVIWAFLGPMLVIVLGIAARYVHPSPPTWPDLDPEPPGPIQRGVSLLLCDRQHRPGN
ncbi:AGRD1-like protein, partial [Mya arenaria]